MLAAIRQELSGTGLLYQGYADMFTNHTDITLFCSKQMGREKVWSRHELRNVNFHGTDQLLVGDKEVKRAEDYIIRVPAAALAHYVDKATYKALPVEETFNCFTLKKVIISLRALWTLMFQALQI